MTGSRSFETARGSITSRVLVLAVAARTVVDEVIAVLPRVRTRREPRGGERVAHPVAQTRDGQADDAVVRCALGVPRRVC
jgi:hypothetical protein